MIDKSSFEFCERGVHVWTLRIQAPPELIARFAEVLSPDEAGRAARFAFQHLRDSFTITRGVLRFLLARYLDVHPAAIRFEYKSRGKPVLATPGLQFNATHSGGLAAFAFTPDCELGIDVEQFRRLTDMVSIADRFFCAEETADILSLPPPAHEPAFFACWTRKEAYIKAIGDGLYAPLDGFRVAVRPDDPVRLIHIEQDEAEAHAWTMHDLRLADGYASALAYRDAPRKLSISPIRDPIELVDSW